MKGFAKRRLRVLRILVMHLMLPVWFIVLMATAGREDSSTWLMLMIASVAYLAFLSMAGAWSWFGVYAQKALPLAMLAAAFVTRPRILAINTSPQAAELRLMCVALSAGLFVMTIIALAG